MPDKSPKYLKIKDYIQNGIDIENFTEQVPSENQLAQKFGVSRMTARRALVELEQEGSVERIAGKGTFVNKHQHYTSGFFRVRPFHKWAEDIGADLRTDVLESRVLEPPKWISQKLNYTGDVILLDTLNYLDETPVRRSVRHIRTDSCPGILWEDLAHESVHDILISKYNLPLTRITQTMTARGLADDEAKLFRVEPGFAVFFFQRLTFSHESPISYVEYTMRGDMAFNDTFRPQLDK